MFMGKTIDTECMGMDILQFTTGTQYKRTKKRDAECFKVYLYPEKYPSSGGFQSSSLKIYPEIYQRNQSKKGTILSKMEHDYGKVLELR